MARFQVLVVDDSPVMRMLVTRALQGTGEIDCVEACDGMEALQKLTADDFDLLISDVNMPVMDGVSLVRLTRQEPRLAALPIVIATAQGADADRERGMAAGANAYLTKPINTRELVRLAKDLLKAS